MQSESEADTVLLIHEHFKCNICTSQLKAMGLQ